MDQLAALRAFIRVVEAGTFTRAAMTLDMPKATVTKLIQSLEAHVRTKLLQRTTRRVTVTPDGAAYYERVVRLLADLDELDGSMTSSQAQPSGRLRVDVGAGLALHVIVPALPRFHARYPDIQLDLGVSDRPVDLIGENVDCVLRGGDLADQSLIARRIGDYRFSIYASPGYLARHGEPSHPRQLQGDHYVVGYAISGSGRSMPLVFDRDGEVHEIEGRRIVAINDSNAYVAAGVAGLGVIQGPDFMVAEHVAAGRLRRIMGGWEVQSVPLYVVYPPNRHVSNRVRVFVDWVAEVIADSGLAQPARPQRVRSDPALSG
jgi:DNA-binding transcriptional LysR family regulator